MVGISATAWVVGGAAVVGGIASYSAAEDQADATSANIEANFAYDMENYNIQRSFHNELQGFRREQEAFADKQLNFAHEQLDYAREQYAIGLENIAKENNFRQMEVYNTKMAATAEYTAQKDSAEIMQYGAQDAVNTAIDETLRAGGANRRELIRQAGKAAGDVQAARGSGITGGASVEREKIAVFMEKNRAMSQLDDKEATSIIQATAARDEMVSNYNMKVAESYRMLDATLRLEAAPVAAIAGPQPIFTEKQPIGPITPLGPKPIKGVAADSGWSSLSAGLSGATQGYNFGTAITNL